MSHTERKYLYQKVLVIDDTDVDRLLAERIVKKYDFAEEIILMNSARQMLDYLQHISDNPQQGSLPQLMLLDIHMPEMDGWEFLQRFDLFDKRVKDQFSIFIVSSSLNLKDKERALTNEYVLDYIVKPMSKEAIFGMNARIEQKVRERIRYLSEALEKEKQLNLLKSRFVSLASHEFRTPVSGILSSANLLSKYTGAGDQPKRDKHIENIKSCVGTLVDILEDFLSVGKIEEGKVNVRPSEFDITGYIGRIILEMQAIAVNGQELRYTHKGPELVFLDPILLRHIMINLISNAIKFSFYGGRIEVGTDTDNRQFTLSVRDYGIGIPDEDQKHLFGLFFRGANAANIQGTGLGLYIVAKYTDMMKGKLEFTTGLNQGTHFTITLPQLR